MFESLSQFAREHSERSFDGPIPVRVKQRIRTIEDIERAFEDSLPPAERALKTLMSAYGEVLRETAKLEAARQLAIEVSSGDRSALESGRPATYRRQASVVAERTAWLGRCAEELRSIAAKEAQK